MVTRLSRYEARRVAVGMAVALVVASLSLVGPATPARGAPASPGFAERMLTLINQARAARGVAPVVASPEIAGVATDAPYHECGFPVAGRSADMGTRNYFSHTVLDCGGRGVAHMLRAAGIASSAVGENIAWVGGITDPVLAAERLHNDLMASTGHRNTILDPGFSHVGVGAWATAAGQTWSGGGAAMANVYVATQIFARHPTVTAPGGRYHALTPSRILDTRFGAGALGAGEILELQVAGRGGVPESGVSAVVLNVAVTRPTAASYLTVFPTGMPLPLASSLNFSAGQTVPNLVTAKLGAGGRLSLFNAAGSTDVVADVAGWYDTGADPTGAGYHALRPERILDSRFGPGPLGSAATLDLQVTGRGGVPASGVSAVVLNVAVTDPTASSYLTVYPAGEAMPVASNLNYVAGQTVPNLVTAKLGAGGRLALFNAAGTVQVIADVAGWYDDGTSATGARYHPLPPSRILDTRFGSGPLPGGAILDLHVTGRGGVPSTGVSAVLVNVAATGPTAPSYLTVFPGGEAVPNAANLNFVAGQTVANLAAATTGAGGAVGIFNAAGTVHVVADVAGWFGAG